MTQISKAMPIDANSKPIPGSIVGAAIAVTYDATISSATDVVLNEATTWIEVAAITKGVFLRYAATASSTAFDEFIPQDTIRGFAVTGGSTISVIEQAATAAVAIIQK